MTLGDLTSRDAVLEAIGEFDRLGQAAFLAKYGYGPSRRYLLVQDGNEYDVKAIAGAAHGFQFPERGALKHDEFTSGLGTVVPKLRSLGFDVVDGSATPLRDASARSSQPMARRLGEAAKAWITS